MQSSSFTIYGDGYWVEKGRFVRLYHSNDTQNWSPLMYERRKAWGIRCFGFEISFAKRRRIFKDGKAPHITRI